MIWGLPWWSSGSESRGWGGAVPVWGVRGGFLSSLATTLLLWGDWLHRFFKRRLLLGSAWGVFLNKRRLDNQGQESGWGRGGRCSDPWDPWGPPSAREPSTWMPCETHTPRAQQAGTATPALWHHGDLRQPRAWTRASMTPRVRCEGCMKWPLETLLVPGVCKPVGIFQ